MKRKPLYTVLLLAVLFCIAGNAAAQSYRGTIKVDPVRAIKHGETLHVEMDLVLEGVKVRSTGGIDLIPRLVSPTDTLDLPKVSLKGRNEYLAYERMISLMSERELNAYDQPYAVEKAYNTQYRTITYRYAMPFKAWMKDARLELQRDECGCGESAWMKTDPLGPVKFEPDQYPIHPHLAFIQPVAEVKAREKQAEVFLDFVVNKVDIRPYYMNNPVELGKIHALINELHDDKDITITRLDIIGYASPEGPLANNRWLSENRANALKNYLASQYSFPWSIYHTVFGGENWDGLRKALVDLNIEHKAEIENILNYYYYSYNGEECKSRLKSLRGGQPYNYLLNNIYPSLRVAICKVGYSIRDFNLEEAREIFKVRPQNLSLNEMYLVANSYPVGSQEFIDVFETAMRLFPEDDVARLNAVSSALLRSDIQTAERYLPLIKNIQSPEYLNAAGVFALLKGDLEAAESYLKRAFAAGLDAARNNLEELEKKKVNKTELDEWSKITKQF